MIEIFTDLKFNNNLKTIFCGYTSILHIDGNRWGCFWRLRMPFPEKLAQSKGTKMRLF